MGSLTERCVSGLGALALLGLAVLLCPRQRRGQIRWRGAGVGLFLLVTIALLVLRTPVRAGFAWANDAVGRLLSFSQRGAAFVFGSALTDSDEFGFVFAFQVLPTIVFFASLMALLYRIGLMPLLIRKSGRLLARALGTSAAESFSTVADIFVGQTEAPLVIRPYIARLTESELMACMVAGFATTGGGVLAAYVLMLRDFVPGIAGHLLSCSVMCAPASLVVAKLMLPENAQPETLGGAPSIEDTESSGLLDAIAHGASDGVRLAINIGAMMVAFLALTALLDALLMGVGSWFGVALSLEAILGVLFAPLAFALGIPADEVPKVAMLLGKKTVFNEFIAYASLTESLSQDAAYLSERSRILVAYALCGFANFGSIGVQIGGYSALAPSRRGDLARLAPRAMLGGLLATCLVACVAGVLL
jgi:CNT family concentrative nucleoside transporter